MAKVVDTVTVEVKPTVTLESAVACVMMLNMFLDDNDGYELECVNRGDGWKWELTDHPKPKVPTKLSDDDREMLADMPALRKLARMAGLEY